MAKIDGEKWEAIPIDISLFIVAKIMVGTLILEATRRFSHRRSLARFNAEKLTFSCRWHLSTLSGGYGDSPAYYVTSILFAILATTWAVNDSRRNQRTFHPVLRMVHLLLCPISLVIYLMYSRGFRGLGLALLHGIAIVIVSSVVFYALLYGVYFSGYWELLDPIYLDS